MDWDSILMWADIPDSPGRDEAVKAAEIKTQQRLHRKLNPKTPSGAKKSQESRP